MSELTIVWIVACAFGLVLALVGEYRDRVSLTFAGKFMASTAYLGVALVENLWDVRWGAWLFAGMSFCWAGDLLLVSRRSRTLFLGGLAAFLMGHVLYTAAFIIRGYETEGLFPAAVLLVFFVVAVQRWLRPHLQGPMVPAVHAYLLAICCMWLTAIATQAAAPSPLLLLGATGFVVSDLAVARNRFIKPDISNRLWGLPLYFAAQLLLALSAG